jgi:hypothetical protein
VIYWTYYSFDTTTLDLGIFPSSRRHTVVLFSLNILIRKCKKERTSVPAPAVLQLEHGSSLSQRIFLCLQALHCRRFSMWLAALVSIQVRSVDIRLDVWPLCLSNRVCTTVYRG